MDYLINEKFCSLLYDEYVARHSQECYNRSLKEQEGICGALMICCERLLNTNPLELIHKATDDWV